MASIASLGRGRHCYPLLAEGLEIQTECFPLCCSEGEGERRTTTSSVWVLPAGRREHQQVFTAVFLGRILCGRDGETGARGVRAQQPWHMRWWQPEM